MLITEELNLLMDLIKTGHDSLSHDMYSWRHVVLNQIFLSSDNFIVP